ncbi:MAG: hypothetical protein A3F17_00485 [Gammaproteobacteria bacterium RIFCSPHIGHO2_12_FULL_41_15]|nr:MAG: hypothetical protein A3F17_00485 [Gammaproteobacteria bacterium RIFCSPHIGHO2_12_FULL_41_15]
MGLRGTSFGSIFLILLIVLLLFGTKRLRNIGEDLGAALKGFRQGVKEQETISQVEHKDDKDV